MKKILITLIAITITPLVILIGVGYSFKEWTKDEIRRRKERYVR